MEESILSSIKKLLGIGEDYTHFDVDIIAHINSVLMVLNQLGVGPSAGFMITGNDETWADFIPDEAHRKLYSSLVSYVHHRVRLLFDPPQNSALIESTNRIISEYEWRLMVAAESIAKEGSA